MSSADHIREHPTAINLFTATDAVSILREHHWLASCDPNPEQLAWCEHAAALLGHYAEQRAGLANLLQLVFEYNAAEILKQPESHAVLARYGARDVIRHLALLLLEPVPVSSDRFKEIVTYLKAHLELRGRDLFYPIRLSLAGRPGEGDLDRVILLLDEAAPLPFAEPVKSARTRILEFCAALD